VVHVVPVVPVVPRHQGEATSAGVTASTARRHGAAAVPKRDAEVIEAVSAAGAAMVFTHRRRFRH